MNLSQMHNRILPKDGMPKDEPKRGVAPAVCSTFVIRHSSFLLLTAGLAIAPTPVATAQSLDFTAIRAEVDFGKRLRPWDGFGFNYVETAHTYDYQEFTQEYGGFSLLDEQEKQAIVDLVFGADGLKVGLVKMFLGANHQAGPGQPFDHETTTKQMRYFVREGFRKTRADGRDLAIITTLYGPPGWMTRQKTKRGRDLDPQHRLELANYLVDWARFLREQEGLPVKYVSLHNEGEDWMRWNQKGFTEHWGHDYNLFWPPEQVTDYVNLGKTKKVRVAVKGSSAKTFTAFRTTEDEQDKYARVGTMAVQEGAVVYEAPGGSVTTFFGMVD